MDLCLGGTTASPGLTIYGEHKLSPSEVQKATLDRVACDDTQIKPEETQGTGTVVSSKNITTMSPQGKYSTNHGV